MAHKKREKYIPYLQERLGGADVSMDDGSLGLWKNAKKCWLSFDPAKKFHLVVQDDSIICDNFREKLEKLLQRHGDNYVYCLFYRHKRKRTHGAMNDAAKAGLSEGGFLYPRLQWANAVVIPTKIIPEMIEFADKVNYTDIDDLRISEYLKTINMPVFYPLPSLVNHRKGENSLIGHVNNLGRTASYYEP